MSTVTAAAQTWTPPSVNLLPPEIGQRRRFRRLQMALGGAVLAAVLLVALLYVLAARQASDAREELDVAEAQGARLSSQTAELAHVPKVFATVEQAEQALRQATSDEIRWSYYVGDLSRVLPPTVWLNTMTVAVGTADATATGTTGTTTTTPAPTTGSTSTPTAESLGTVTFTGSAYTHDDVATWLDVLGRQDGYKDPYLTNSTKRDVAGTTVVDFTSQVQITDEALWRNYRNAARGG